MKKQKGSTNVSTLSLLGIVFVTLKLCSVIAWSWWWVLLPFYGCLILLVLLNLLVMAVSD